MISAANLLGDKFINITKGTRARACPARRGEFSLRKAQDIPELMAQSANLLAALPDHPEPRGSLVGGSRRQGQYRKVDQGRGTVQPAERRRGRRSADCIADVRNGKGTISQLIYDDALYKEIRSPMSASTICWRSCRRAGHRGKADEDPALYDDAQDSIAEIAHADRDQRRKGTAGKLLKDEQLYRQFNQLMAKIDTTIDKINSGQGTLGQLMVNPQLYDSLNGATREAQALLKDIRANPKKFLRIKLALF